jgi:uncharacterized Zn finger protein
MTKEFAQPEIPLSKTTPIVCESCGGQVFTHGFMLRKGSKFLTGSSKDTVTPIPTFSCSKCGHVNQDFIPAEIQKADA